MTKESSRVIALLALAAPGTPAGDVRRWRGRLTVLVVLTAVVSLCLPSAAQEPLVLTGTWAGTWWMGKYEEPIELDLTQTRGALAGHVTLWGYPAAGSSGAATTVRAPVTGTVQGQRAQLTWTLPKQLPFSVELTPLTADRLFGLGGAGSITAGFELQRSR
jgi:hypothetical protein